jgi:hypothetical protein
MEGDMDIAKARCPGCDQPMQVRQVHCPSCSAALDGEFTVSALGMLAPEEQVFVHSFLRSHGSIKRMEELYGISYPTVKNRLNAIVAQLDQTFEMPAPNTTILEALARGEITVAEALKRIS